MVPHTGRHFKGLILIVVFSLVWKVALLLIALYQSNPDLFISNDTQSYVSSAQALLQTGTFTVAPNNLEPQTIRTPGYPIFLALIYGLVGENLIAVIVVQILFSVGTIVLVYWMGCILWDGTTGLLASLLLALDMNSIGFTLVLLSETLFTFFLCAFIALTIWITKTESSFTKSYKLQLAFFLSGTFLAIATHVRPISYYFIFLMIPFWIFWGLMSKLDRQKLVMEIVIFSIPLLVLVGGWQVRNYLQTGSSQFCSIENLSIINYRAAMIVAERDGISRDGAIVRITEQYGLDRKTGWNDTWRRIGVKIISENPLIFLKQYLKGMVSIFLGPGSERLPVLVGINIGASSPLGDILRLSTKEYVAQWILPHPIYFGAFVFSVLHMLIIYAGVVLWIVQFLLKHKIIFEKVFLFSVLLYFVLVSAGPEAYYRFRVPITPILVLLSASVMKSLFSDGRAILRKDSHLEKSAN